MVKPWMYIAALLLGFAGFRTYEAVVTKRLLNELRDLGLPE